MGINRIPEADPKATQDLERSVESLLAHAKSTPPPRWRHESMIQLHRLHAYYQVLNDVPSFRLCLGWLFENWSWTDAARFVRRFRLPEYAIKDLAWSRDLRKRWKMDRAALHVGSRAFPGIEPPIAEEEVKRLGYRPEPPRLKDPDSLGRGALRLYRRAVLGLSWQKIAEDESDASKQHPDANTPKSQIKAWATGLGVTLPCRRAGRPRGN